MKSKGTTTTTNIQNKHHKRDTPMRPVINYIYYRQTGRQNILRGNRTIYQSITCLTSKAGRGFEVLESQINKKRDRLRYKPIKELWLHCYKQLQKRKSRHASMKTYKSYIGKNVYTDSKALKTRRRCELMVSIEFFKCVS